MTIRDELIALKNDDPLFHPQHGVEWARSHPESALHQALEWDDSVAGEKYRIWQVRELIAIHVTTPEGERQWHALSIDRPAGGYREREDILEVPALRDCLLADALRDLERVQRQYNQLKELAEVWEAIDKAKAKSKTKSKTSSRRQSRRRGDEDRPTAG